MKKFISVVIAFIIVWAILSGVVYLVFPNRHEETGWSYYIVTGFGMTLAGLLGPKIDYVIGKFKKN